MACPMQTQMKTMCLLLACCKMQLVVQYVACSPFFCDNTRFFSVGAPCVKSASVTGRSFCRSSNRLLDSVLVMFLRARRWLVGACAFHIQPAKRTLRMSTKLPFPPTFVLPVAEIALPMCHKMVWLALFTELCLGQPIISYRGDIRVCVGKKIVIKSCTTGAEVRLYDIRLTV